MVLSTWLGLLTPGPVRQWISVVLSHLVCATLLQQLQETNIYGIIPSPTKGVGNSQKESESHSVMSDCLQPHGLYSPWNSPGQNTGVGSCCLLQGIFPTQESNWSLLHCRWILCQLSYQERTHSSILAKRIPMERGPWWATIHSQRMLGNTDNYPDAPP